MPLSTLRTRRPVRDRRATLAALAIVCALTVAACGDEPANSAAALDGLVVLAAGTDKTSLSGWSGDGADGVPITLPKGDTVWIATGRSDVLAATLAAGTTATSDPVRLGKPLDWRTIRPVDPAGDPPGHAYFATWDPGGGRYAVLAGDLASGDGVQAVLIDPSVSSSFAIPIDRAVLAAPPAWLDSDRLIIVTGDASTPRATIIDTTTSELTDGPADVRLLATSADGHRIATMAGPGAPIMVRDAAAWLSGDGSSLGSVDPPDSKATAIAFALDTTGERLAIAWAAADGTVSLVVHDGRAGWRRAAKPDIGPAMGAVVAWRR